MKVIRFIVTASVILNLSACTKTAEKKKEKITIPPSGMAGTHDTQKKIPPLKAGKNSKTISGVITQALIKKGFSYIEIKQADSKKAWVALVNAKVKVGEKISVKSELTLEDFESKTLDRTFTNISFGSIVKYAVKDPNKKQNT